jgi:hypothetical protein
MSGVLELDTIGANVLSGFTFVQWSRYLRIPIMPIEITQAIQKAL